MAPRRLGRALNITQLAVQNSALRRREDRRHGADVARVTIAPPLFVLGHYRNGTTHLHNLLATDERFAFPTTFQAFFPHACLTTEAIGSRVLSFFLPPRRPMDNVEWSGRAPQEDEFALGITSQKSPLMGWVFPRRRHHYDRYLTFRGVPDTEVAEWRVALQRFLGKLTWRYGRPLVLKSPPHTCRIRLLLEMFPRAKFVHIHRDPRIVFPSSQHTFRVNFDISGLQDRIDDLDGWIVRQYRAMYDVFFEERPLIPRGHLHEVGFEDLERDPLGEMRRLYAALDLPDFGKTEPALRRYVASIAAYRKNEFPALPADLAGRIADAWRPCFEAWGYPAAGSAR